jgi:C4-dicarboxylate-specific signal transduction histidine kinase
MPVQNEQGEAVEWFGTDTDVEGRRQAEEALQRAQAELAHVARLTTVGELAASIAHELNQPLGAIVNNGSVCLRRLTAAPGDSDEVRAALSDIISDANRASAVIARIRALTKRSAAERVSLQLNEVVADVSKLAQSALAERRITLHTELSDDLPRILGDRVEIQQVLLNLVMNGIEAMSDLEEAKRVMTIGGQHDELNGAPAVRVCVHDFGVGVAPENIDRLFDPFYTTKPEGMGMGLRISRSIVEAHGGRLWATSNAGPGMTFSCALPAQTPDAP